VRPTSIPNLQLPTPKTFGDDGSSDRDKVAKRKIVLRELKETNFRLKVLRRSGFLTEAQDPVLQETEELIKIVATLVRNSRCADQVKGRTPTSDMRWFLTLLYRNRRLVSWELEVGS
jgi:hypothetical protein